MNNSNYPFYTEEFKSNPLLTLSIFNELIDKKLIAKQEMYKSGTFFYFEVQDNKKSRLILTPIISDFDKYLNHYDKIFKVKKLVGIPLCAVHLDHQKTFDPYDEIMFDFENKEFINKGMWLNEDEI